MLSVVMLSVVMLSVVMLSDMLSVFGTTETATKTENSTRGQCYKTFYGRKL
jgi:hypothetical protein